MRSVRLMTPHLSRCNPVPVASVWTDGGWRFLAIWPGPKLAVLPVYSVGGWRIL